MLDQTLTKILENQSDQAALLASLDAKVTAHLGFTSKELARLALREEELTAEVHRAQGAIRLGAVLMTFALTGLGLVVAALRLWKGGA